MKKALLYLVGVLFILAIIGGWTPSKGWIFPSANEINLQPPAGYLEYLQKLENAKQKESEKLGSFQHSFKMGSIGVTEMIFRNNIPIETDSKSFLSFYNLYVKDYSKLDGAIYSVENMQPYIIKDNKKEKFPFYLKTNNDQNKGNRYDDQIVVMQPIGKNTKVMIMIIWGIFIIVGLCIVYIFLSGIFKIISSISQAKVFTRDTINTLKNLSYIFFIIPLVGLLLSVSTWLYVYIKYPGGFCLDPEVYFFTARSLVLAAFVYALYRAFRKGYELQQENDLTV